MNQKKKQEKTKFSKLRLRSSARVSKKSDSPQLNPREKISSYFASSLNEATTSPYFSSSSSLNETTNQRDSEEIFLSTIESQYGQKFSCDNNADSAAPKNKKLSKAYKKEPKLNLENDPTDENDFAEPKIIKPTKIFEIKSEKVKRKRTKNNNDLARFIKDFGPSCSDTNQENLHVAYAMSKSLEEFQNPGKSTDSQDSMEYESTYPSTQQKIATIKSTLDQFGFKTNRAAVAMTSLKNNANQKKFKFLTPTLFLRTDEDRERLIESKVSRIFDNITVYNKHLKETEAKDNLEKEFEDNKPRSFLLREFYDENATLFRKNHLDISEINESTFYNKIVPREIVKSGILLKDWGSIPGRERTPPLPVNITVEETEELQYENNEKQEHLLQNRKQKNAEMDWSLILDRRSPPVSITVEETEEPQYEKKEKQDYIAENEKQKNAEIDWGSIPDRSSPVSIIVEETEDPQYENKGKQDHIAENEKQKTAEVCEIIELRVNTKMDHCISPELFSDSDLELSIQKSPIKSLNHPQKSPINLNSSPILLHTNNTNKETSPVIFISSSNSTKIGNSPVLPEKEIFSDDSDAKSLSLLDNISPRRYKNKSPKKSINFSFKKSLFGTDKTESVSLDIENVTSLNASKNDPNETKNSSPFETLQNASQICHYESFCDNSNDCFDLTRSSNESNDNFSIPNLSIKDKQITDDPISDNLFESDHVTEMGGHDDNYSAVIQLRKNKEDLIDLTQSSNEDDVILNKNENIGDTVRLQNKINDLEEENSNDSVKTVLLLNRNKSLDIIAETEEIETIPLQNKTDLESKFEEEYSPEFDLLNPSNNKDFYKSLSFISDSESEAEKSPKKLQKRLELSPDKTVFLKPKLNQSRSESTPKILRKEIDVVSPVADKTDFFKLSSPLHISKYYFESSLKDNENADKLSQSVEDIEISDEELNYSVNKCKKFKAYVNDISRSSNESEIINDVELNYPINKSKLVNKNEASCSKTIDDNNPEDDLQFLSQSSIGSCSDISDEELNYSTNISFNKKKLKQIEDIINTKEDFRNNLDDFPDVMDFNDLPESVFEPSRTSLNINETIKHPRITELSTPTKFNQSLSVQQDDSFDKILKQTEITPKIDGTNMKTPDNAKVNPVLVTPTSDHVIKTTNVTPMPNYKEMDSPELIKELDKFGVKPLKRAKGIKLLQYIYNATHPILQNSEIAENTEKIRESSSEEEDRIIKRRKRSPNTNIPKRLSEHFENKETIECLGNEISNSEKLEDMIYERKQSVRIASCRLPLHIAWHNLLSSNPELHEKILLYEPIQVEDIYAKLKSFGYKFHIQDIISFLDKKCITIRVAQNNQKKKSSS